MGYPLAMTKPEREQFLADVHIGVLSVAAPDGPPLVTPIWYRYEPGGDVVMVTEEESVKSELLRAAGEASLCVQREENPPAYVTVSGPVTLGDATLDERTGLASRYLGEELGRQYIESGAAEDNLRIALTPRRWRTTDFAKLSWAPEGNPE
jgi:PPOX class probable F420-dependent enzyme